MRAPRRQRLVEGDQLPTGDLGNSQHPCIRPDLRRSRSTNCFLAESLLYIGWLGNECHPVVVKKAVVDAPSLVDCQRLAIHRSRRGRQAQEPELGEADKCYMSLMLPPPSLGKRIVWVLGRRKCKPDIDIWNAEFRRRQMGALATGTR